MFKVLVRAVISFTIIVATILGVTFITNLQQTRIINDFNLQQIALENTEIIPIALIDPNTPQHGSLDLVFINNTGRNYPVDIKVTINEEITVGKTIFTTLYAGKNEPLHVDYEVVPSQLRSMNELKLSITVSTETNTLPLLKAHKSTVEFDFTQKLQAYGDAELLQVKDLALTPEIIKWDAKPQDVSWQFKIANPYGVNFSEAYYKLSLQEIEGQKTYDLAVEKIIIPNSKELILQQKSTLNVPPLVALQTGSNGRYTLVASVNALSASRKIVATSQTGPIEIKVLKL